MPIKPVVDEHAVRTAEGEVLEGGEGIRVGGWVVETRSSSITADADLDRLKGRLHVLALPEQFFGSNSLNLRHEASGVTLRFDALGAVQGWIADKSEPVRIGDAELWQRSRERDVKETGAKTLTYDWTFTTCYTGSVERGKPAANKRDPGVGDGRGVPPTEEEAPSPAPAAAAAAVAAAGGGAEGGAAAEGGSAGGGAAAAAALPWWQPTLEQMDRGMLMSRDPILFFADLPLYESELEDHGASQLSVKLRVMPRCWYVLLRFWLRVDKVLVRLRETRLFCRFDQPAAAAGAVVLREVKHSEGTFEELRRGGAPPEGPAYADADSAASALQAVAPVGVKLYQLERLKIC